MTTTYDQHVLEDIKKGKSEWDKDLEKTFSKKPARLERFSTVSDLETEPLYTPEDVKDQEFMRDIGFPGQYPFTRGVQPST